MSLRIFLRSSVFRALSANDFITNSSTATGPIATHGYTSPLSIFHGIDPCLLGTLLDLVEGCCVASIIALLYSAFFYVKTWTNTTSFLTDDVIIAFC